LDFFKATEKNFAKNKRVQKEGVKIVWKKKRSSVGKRGRMRSGPMMRWGRRFSISRISAHKTVSGGGGPIATSIGGKSPAMHIS